MQTQYIEEIAWCIHVIETPSIEMGRRFDRADVAWPSFLVVNLSSSTL
jgi:hypothetical protein